MPADSPLRISRDERRQSIARRFVELMPDLLESASYSELSVATMIAAGRISRASFYRYFEDKGDLLLEMIGAMMDELMGGADDWWGQPLTATKQDLAAALRRVIAIYRRHRLLLRSVVEVASYDASVQAAFSEIIGGACDRLQLHIEHGQAEGFINPQLAVRPTAELLVLAGERSLYQMIGLQNETDAARYPDPLAEIFWLTLYQGYRSPSGGLAAR